MTKNSYQANLNVANLTKLYEKICSTVKISHYTFLNMKVINGGNFGNKSSNKFITEQGPNQIFFCHKVQSVPIFLRFYIKFSEFL